MRLVLLLLLFAPAPLFREVSQREKIDFEHHNAASPGKLLPETMGGGVALFDFDNDGRLDLFFTNGAQLGQPRPKSDPAFWNRLYHQNADGTFTDVTRSAGVSGETSNCYSMGVAVADFDGDGWRDLFVTGYGGNTLYRNNGDGTFTDVTARAGVGGSGWSVSAAFFDFDNDGKLDLFVTRYLNWTPANNRFCEDRVPGSRAYCHPNHFDPVSSTLYRNLGNGRFADVSQETGIGALPGKALGVAIADFDGDGWTDLFLANDSSPGQLLHNERGKRFTDTALLSGVAFNEDGQVVAGMGVDAADFDNDGRPDLVITDLSGERYQLFHNNGDGTFTDRTLSSGLGQASQTGSGWGIKFVDIDNDGWKDLLIAQGHVLDNIELAGVYHYAQPPLALLNRAGHFAPVEAFAKPAAGRGAAFGDWNNDGCIDAVFSNLGQRPYLLQGVCDKGNHWLRIQLAGSRFNRDGIGARVKVVTASATQYFTVSTSSSYASASDSRLLVGLGQDAAASLVEVRWPGGAVSIVRAVAGNRDLLIRE